MRCEKCGDKIPQERLDILPNTRTCVRCSDERPRDDVEIDEASNLED